MSVIGRLDGQLEAVLIAPLERRGESDEDARAHRDERAAQVEQTPRESRARGQAQPPADELPVWLL